ncbi:MAG TPA: MHYT domain-containing protein [Rugosimonospora sp.]|nr:MHYT domain-containing protein [Rugosimonospora sp.]
MPVVHQFAYGAASPLAGYVMATIGSLIGLGATAQARRTRHRWRRMRWLTIASVSIGAGIWLMHFTAALGFDVPAAPVRYDAGITAASAVMAIVVVGIGVGIAGYGRQSPGRVMAAGLFTGGGVAAMHYTGMAAMHLPGRIGYDTSIVAASVLVAVVAATVALWFTVTVDNWWHRVGAAAVMGVAVTGMHYTGMAAVRVHLDPMNAPVTGVNPILLVLPITVIAAGALIGLVFTALQAISQEDFEPLPQPARVLANPITPVSPAVPVSRTTGTVYMGQLMPREMIRQSRG